MRPCSVNASSVDSVVKASIWCHRPVSFLNDATRAIIRHCRRDGRRGRRDGRRVGRRVERRVGRRRSLLAHRTLVIVGPIAEIPIPVYVTVGVSPQATKYTVIPIAVFIPFPPKLVCGFSTFIRGRDPRRARDRWSIGGYVVGALQLRAGPGAELTRGAQGRQDAEVHAPQRTRGRQP